MKDVCRGLVNQVTLCAALHLLPAAPLTAQLAAYVALTPEQLVESDEVGVVRFGGASFSVDGGICNSERVPSSCARENLRLGT